MIHKEIGERSCEGIPNECSSVWNGFSALTALKAQLRDGCWMSEDRARLHGGVGVSRRRPQRLDAGDESVELRAEAQLEVPHRRNNGVVTRRHGSRS